MLLHTSLKTTSVAYVEVWVALATVDPQHVDPPPPFIWSKLLHSMVEVKVELVGGLDTGVELCQEATLSRARVMRPRGERHKQSHC